ncbi:MAG: response regulator [Gammaproteobacteria bacterium]|nr:response regulator [Gammaproteobacteria bacterium]MDH5801681.1 response regulator [Gammaproteobacteria bacterium]
MKTALVIEDNSNNMELITFLLKANGFSVIPATLGAEGIEIFKTADPDFILLDIQLPDMDGIEVLRRIRNMEKGLSIPIIAVSSYALTGDSVRLIASGCAGYIEKPIDPASVIGEINRIVENCVA